MRRDVRDGRRGGSAAPATYQSILGALLVEEWDARLGIALVSGNVDTWTGQKLGTVAQARSAGQRPTYAADGSYFNGLPVVQAAATGSLSLVVAALATPLAAAGTTPWIWICCRLRTIGAGTLATIIEGTNNPATVAQPLLYTLSGNINANHNATTATVAYSDTTPHSLACAYSSSGAIQAIKDTTVIATAGAGLSITSTGISDLGIGGTAPNGTNASDTSFVKVAVISGPPSPAQQAALLGLDKDTWGF